MGRNPISSPAARGRGLKLLTLGHEPDRLSVARRARAWIETTVLLGLGEGTGVARRARAWIETYSNAA